MRPDLWVHLSAAEAEFWTSPDFFRPDAAGVPEALRSTAKRFLNDYRRQLRAFETEYERVHGGARPPDRWLPPAHSEVRLASGCDRLTFAGEPSRPITLQPYLHCATRHQPKTGSNMQDQWLLGGRCASPRQAHEKLPGELEHRKERAVYRARSQIYAAYQFRLKISLRAIWSSS